MRNDFEKCVTKSEASRLLNQAEGLEIAFVAVFWNIIRERFNATNKKLQSIEIDVGTEVDLHNFLQLC